MASIAIRGHASPLRNGTQRGREAVGSMTRP
jgi:hypothetical protein